MNLRPLASPLLTLFAALVVLVFAIPPHVAKAADEGANAQMLELGKKRYGENCSGFCHGAGGRGGRAPCLVCGVFKRGGTDEAIIKNIIEGIPGTPMGAFGDKLPKEEIVSLVAYLRAEQQKKAAESQ